MTCWKTENAKQKIVPMLDIFFIYIYCKHVLQTCNIYIYISIYRNEVNTYPIVSILNTNWLTVTVGKINRFFTF